MLVQAVHPGPRVSVSQLSQQMSSGVSGQGSPTWNTLSDLSLQVVGNDIDNNGGEPCG